MTEANGRIGISPLAEALQDRADCIVVGEITPGKTSRFKVLILATPNDRLRLPLPIIKGNQEKDLLKRLQEEGIVTSVTDLRETHIDTDEKNVVFGRATVERYGEEQKIIFYPTIKFSKDAIAYFYASLNDNIESRNELVRRGVYPKQISLEDYNNLPLD